MEIHIHPPPYGGAPPYGGYTPILRVYPHMGVYPHIEVYPHMGVYPHVGVCPKYGGIPICGGYTSHTWDALPYTGIPMYKTMLSALHAALLCMQHCFACSMLSTRFFATCVNLRIGRPRRTKSRSGLHLLVRSHFGFEQWLISGLDFGRRHPVALGRHPPPRRRHTLPPQATRCIPSRPGRG